MKTIRQQMIAKLHIILKQQNATEHKAVIYAGYGVKSSREMTDAQLSHLIGQLEGSTQTVTPTTSGSLGVTASSATRDDYAIRKLRSLVLSLLTKSPRSTSTYQRGLGLPNDFVVLNPFIERHAGKLLYELTMDELETFRRKILAIRASGWSYQGEAPQNPHIKIAKPAPQPTTSSRSYMIMPTGKILS